METDSLWLKYFSPSPSLTNPRWTPNVLLICSAVPCTFTVRVVGFASVTVKPCCLANDTTLFTSSGEAAVAAAASPCVKAGSAPASSASPGSSPLRRKSRVTVTCWLESVILVQCAEELCWGSLPGKGVRCVPLDEEESAFDKAPPLGVPRPVQGSQPLCAL